MQSWLARGREDSGSLLPSQEETDSCSSKRKTKRQKKTRADEREDGEFMEISPSETFMHVSPISVTKRLLATFCPRDNSLSFFIALPISQLKNCSRKVSVYFEI